MHAVEYNLHFFISLHGLFYLIRKESYFKMVTKYFDVNLEHRIDGESTSEISTYHEIIIYCRTSNGSITIPL